MADQSDQMEDPLGMRQKCSQHGKKPSQEDSISEKNPARLNPFTKPPVFGILANFVSSFRH